LSTKPIRLALCRFAPRLGDLDANVPRVTQLAREHHTDLLVLPELALSISDVRERVHELGRAAVELPARLGAVALWPRMTCYAPWFDDWRGADRALELLPGPALDRSLKRWAGAGSGASEPG
jgi:hypothetical protein